MIDKNFKFCGNDENCRVRNILDRFGDKWSMLVLLILTDEEVLRFNELHKRMGTISQKMLSVTLKTLEADGLVSRQVYPEVPPRVEYRLTERGQSLIPHLQSLVAWADVHFKDIQASRARFSR